MNIKDSTLTNMPMDQNEKRESMAQEMFFRLLKNKGAVIGLIFLLLLILVSIFADVLYDYDTEVIAQNVSERLLKPSWEHPFGTDEYGRDLLARVIHGSRITLLVSFSSVIIALVIGGSLGAIAGFFGNKIDNIIMRITDVVLAIPMTLFSIVIVAALGTSTTNLIIALAVSTVPVFARVVRSAVLTVRDAEYIEASNAIGARNGYIIIRHILPNCIGPIFVQVTLRVAQAIYNTSALSFLGLGVSAPAPEWGALLASGRTFIRNQSYMSVIPGFAIMFTILSLNMLGDGLRDAMDPKLR